MLNSYAEHRESNGWGTLLPGLKTEASAAPTPPEGFVTLTEQYALASDDAFIGEVMICVAKAAIAISGEVCGGSEQPSNAAHAKRAKWAMEALLSPRTMAEKMAVGVAANGTITIASEDADIEWTVSSIIDDYAGVD